jgi:hypothetical protein
MLSKSSPLKLLGQIKPSQAVSEEIFLIVANQKKELLLAAMFIGRMEPQTWQEASM